MTKKKKKRKLIKSPYILSTDDAARSLVYNNHCFGHIQKKFYTTWYMECIDREIYYIGMYYVGMIQLLFVNKKKRIY